jgi:predicted lipoprotein with Yx(FWY)xxD motif
MTGHRRPRRGTRLAGQRRLIAVAAFAAVIAGAGAAVLSGSPLGGSGGSPVARTAADTRSVPPNQSYVAPPVSPSARPLGGLVPAAGRRPAHPPGFPSPSPATQTLPPPSTAVLTIEVATSPTFGPVLVDTAGMTLYRDTAEAGGSIACLGSCTQTRRPLLARPGQALRLPPLLHGQLSTLTRPDGGIQVTYDGWPLYTCTGDHAQGDTNGTGGDWQVIKATS